MTTKKRRARRPPPLFPRGKIKPLPRFEAPGASFERHRAERRARAREALVEAQRRRVAEIKAAFAEGWRFGREWLDPVESWRSSRAYAGLWPAVRGPGDAIRQLQHEWKLRAGAFHDEAYAARWHQRCAEVEAAFFEGHAVGAAGHAIRAVWLYTRTRRDLYPGPPCPLHLQAKMTASGVRVDRVRWNAR